MRTILAAAALAAAIGFVSCQEAAAVPAAGGAIQQSAATASAITHTQYAERHTRRHTTKCYREFVVGNYVCHTYRNW